MDALQPRALPDHLTEPAPFLGLGQLAPFRLVLVAILRPRLEAVRVRVRVRVLSARLEAVRARG